MFYRYNIAVICSLFPELSTFCQTGNKIKVKLSHARSAITTEMYPRNTCHISSPIEVIKVHQTI